MRGILSLQAILPSYVYSRNTLMVVVQGYTYTTDCTRVKLIFTHLFLVAVNGFPSILPRVPYNSTPKWGVKFDPGANPQVV